MFWLFQSLGQSLLGASATVAAASQDQRVAQGKCSPLRCLKLGGKQPASVFPIEGLDVWLDWPADFPFDLFLGLIVSRGGGARFGC